MYLYDCSAPALAGHEVFSGVDADQPAGVVVNAALRPAQGGSALLVSVKISDFDSGDLHLGAAAGPRLDRRDLPYPIALAHSDGA